MATSLLANDAVLSTQARAGGTSAGSSRNTGSCRPRFGPPASNPGHGKSISSAALGR
jgi:hypothetical protein